MEDFCFLPDDLWLLLLAWQARGAVWPHPSGPGLSFRQNQFFPFNDLFGRRPFFFFFHLVCNLLWTAISRLTRPGGGAAAPVRTGAPCTIHAKLYFLADDLFAFSSSRPCTRLLHVKSISLFPAGRSLLLLAWQARGAVWPHPSGPGHSFLQNQFFPFIDLFARRPFFFFFHLVCNLLWTAISRLTRPGGGAAAPVRTGAPCTIHAKLYFLADDLFAFSSSRPCTRLLHVKSISLFPAGRSLLLLAWQGRGAARPCPSGPGPSSFRDKFFPLRICLLASFFYISLVQQFLFWTAISRLTQGRGAALPHPSGPGARIHVQLFFTSNRKLQLPAQLLLSRPSRPGGGVAAPVGPGISRRPFFLRNDLHLFSRPIGRAASLPHLSRPGPLLRCRALTMIC